MLFGLFFFLSLVFAVDVVDTLLKGWAHVREVGPLYALSMGMMITFCLIGALTKSSRYHGAFAAFFLVYNLSLLGSNLLRLM